MKGATYRPEVSVLELWKFRTSRFAPVGSHCPFVGTEIVAKRTIEWKSCGKTSVHPDDWQVSPHQRTCSRSWVGRTWFTQRMTSTLNGGKSKPQLPRQGPHRISKGAKAQRTKCLNTFGWLRCLLQRGKLKPMTFQKQERKDLKGTSLLGEVQSFKALMKLFQRQSLNVAKHG